MIFEDTMGPHHPFGGLWEARGNRAHYRIESQESGRWAVTATAGGTEYEHADGASCVDYGIVVCRRADAMGFAGWWTEVTPVRRRPAPPTTFEGALRRLVAMTFGSDATVEDIGSNLWRLTTSDEDDHRVFDRTPWELLRDCNDFALYPSPVVTPVIQRLVAEAFGEDVELEGHEDDGTWTFHNRRTRRNRGSEHGFTTCDVLAHVSDVLELG